MPSCPSENNNNNNKMDDNAPIHISRPDGYDPSTDASGCFFSSEYSELAKGGIAAVVERFQAAAKSNNFVQHWSHSGFTSPSFHPNTYLKPGVPAYDKFVEGLQDLGHATRLGLVFHGTSTSNIPAILQNGLDPKRRSGQAYGPGEYFGKNPSISVSYCKGGKEMMVFAVVIPSSLTLSVEEEKKLQQQQEEARKKREIINKAREAMETSGSSSNNSNNHSSSTATSTLPSQPTLPVFRYNSCPPDFVVVNNNLHQIPIGTMKFSAVDHSVMLESQNKRAKLLQLNKEVFEKSQIAQEGEIKAKIIQLMIAEKIDLAAEKYDKQKSFLKKSSKAEIAWYASQKLDEDVIPAYFPDLPPPMSLTQLEEAKIASVDETTRQHLEAKERLEKEREALYGAKIAEPKKPPAVLVAKNTATANNSSSNTHNATGKTSSSRGAFSSVFSAFSTKAPSSAMKHPANPFAAPKMEGLNAYQRKSLQNRTDAAILGAASTSTASTSALSTASSSDSSGHSDQATATPEGNPRHTMRNNGSSTSVNNTSTSPSGGGVGTIQKAVTKLTVDTNASREETKQSKAKTATQNPYAVASFTASAEVFNATTEIIRHLVGDRVDIAAELYTGKHASLFEAANEDAEVMERKREISQYVYRTIPPDVAPHMFPGLPDPTPTTPRKRKDAPDSSTSSTDSSTTSSGSNNGMDISNNSTTSQNKGDQQELWGLFVES